MSMVKTTVFTVTLCLSFTTSLRQSLAEEIDEVVVVSTRTDQSIVDVPAAVSLVNRSEIQLGRQQIGLDESLNRVPGLFSQNRYNFAQDLRLAIRGFGARANFGIRGIKIYADGIPVTTADGQSGVDDIDLGTIDRIEVIRGPSSSLYGAASGGVINMFTEDGSDIPYLHGAVTLGEGQQRKYQIKAGGQRDRINYFTSLTALNYDGQRDNSELETNQFNSKLRYDFIDASLSLILNLVDSPVANDAGALTEAQVEADPSQAQPRNLSSNAGESVKQRKVAWIYKGTLANNVKLSMRNYYVWRNFDAFLPIGTHIPFVSDDGVVQLDRYIYGGGIDANLNHELFGLANQLTVGFEVDLQEDNRQRYLNNAGVKGELSFDQVEKAEAYGIFIRNEMLMSDNWAFIQGLRYDDIKLIVDDNFLTNGDQSSRLSFDEFSPMLGLIFSVNNSINFYSNYATSFETPTFTELASPARNLAISLGGFNNVSTQQATSFEIGFKGNFSDGRIYLDLAIYKMKVDDEITNIENIDNRSIFENADTDRRGLELSIVGQVSKQMRLSFAYTYSDFVFGRFPTEIAFEGNALPGLPEHQTYFEINYHHQSGYYGVADLLYIDELFVDNANSIVNDSSMVTNLRAGYLGGKGSWRWSPFVGINNLFNEEYNSNVRINGFGGRLFEPAPETNAYIGFTLDYEMK